MMRFCLIYKPPVFAIVVMVLGSLLWEQARGACTPPANETCAGATPITLGNCLTSQPAGCSGEGAVSCGGANNANGASIWFSFNAPADGDVFIDVTLGICGGSAYYSPVVVYGSCGGAEITCVYTGAISTDFLLPGLTPGNPYYIDIAVPAPDGGGKCTLHDICIYDDIVCPGEGACTCGAVLGACGPSSGTCVSGTLNGATACFAAAGCIGANPNVGFNFTPTGTSITVTVDNVGSSFANIEVMVGNMNGCPTWSSMGRVCQPPPFTNTFTGLTAGTKYTVFVSSSNGANDANTQFGICINNGGSSCAVTGCGVVAGTAGNAYGVYAGDGTAGTAVDASQFLSINDGTGTVCNVCSPTDVSEASVAISGYPVIGESNINCTGVNITYTAGASALWNLGTGATNPTPTGASVVTQYTAGSFGRKNIVYSGNTYTGFQNITMNPPSNGLVLGTATGCPGIYNYSSSEAGSPGFAYSWTATNTSGCGGSCSATIASQFASSTNITFTNTTAISHTWDVTLTITTECCGALTPVTYVVTINPIPANPAATAIPASVCTGGSSALSVTGPIAGYAYSWFTVPTGGTAFATGTTTNINPVLSGATTYYIDAVSDKGCPAAARGSVAVTGTNTPPTVLDPASECAPGIITATVSAPVAGATYNWYSDVGLTILLQSSTSTSYGINVPGPPNSVTVYVTVIVPGCGASTSDPTTASITAPPASVTWDGSTSTNWFVADNWTPPCVPNSAVDAVIANAAARECSIDFDLGGIASVKSITIESSRTLTMVGNKAILEVYGNWANNGAFVANTGLVIFKGTSAQAISGSTTTTFYNLTNDNGSAAVTLSQNVIVAGVLHLEDGVLSLNGKKVTAIAGGTGAITRSCGYILSESAAALVEWNNTPAAAGNYVFPFGYGGNYIPFIFAKDAGDPANNIAVSTWNTTSDDNCTPGPASPANCPTAPKGKDFFVDRWWSITPSPVCTCGVTFYFTDDELNTILDPTLTEPVTYHWNSTITDWDELIATKSGNSVTSTWWSFSGGGGGGKGGGVPLPVTTLFFNAVYNAEKEMVDISWATLSEINNDYFTVERSRDGKNFEKVIVVDGAGNSNERRDYYSVDPDPWYGLSYYRLKQTDYDGKFTYSQAVAVNIARTYDFTIKPNPARDELFVLFTNTEETDVWVDVFNNRGKIIFSEKHISKKGDNTLKLDTRKYPSGMYYLRFSSDWDVYHVKFVKE